MTDRPSCVYLLEWIGRDDNHHVVTELDAECGIFYTKENAQRAADAINKKHWEYLRHEFIQDRAEELHNKRAENRPRLFAEPFIREPYVLNYTDGYHRITERKVSDFND